MKNVLVQYNETHAKIQGQLAILSQLVDEHAADLGHDNSVDLFAVGDLCSVQCYLEDAINYLRTERIMPLGKYES